MYLMIGVSCKIQIWWVKIVVKHCSYSKFCFYQQFKSFIVIVKTKGINKKRDIRLYT